MLPLSAYVRPLAKSISRFESSLSALCRFRITGTESLNLSAICCASLKLRGSTRCTLTLLASTPRNRAGRDERLDGGGAADGAASALALSSVHESGSRRRGRR